MQLPRYIQYKYLPGAQLANTEYYTWTFHSNMPNKHLSWNHSKKNCPKLSHGYGKLTSIHGKFQFICTGSLAPADFSGAVFTFHFHLLIRIDFVYCLGVIKARS